MTRGTQSWGEGPSTPAPPPFLNKTFDIVSDPFTDPIVAWGDNGDRSLPAVLLRAYLAAVQALTCAPPGAALW